MDLSTQGILVILLVGLIAGWLAGQIVCGGGMGLMAELAVGIVGAWIAARRDRPRLAMTIAVAATLLGSLHSLDYDAAILAPFALAAVLGGGWIAIAYAGALVLPPSSWTVLALGTLAVLELGWGSRLRAPLPWPGSKQNRNML